ncbi:tyrosine-type recombinase/integrase [Camelimonas lactis]|uniref:tyrosine-type recombinase/integrase n=1 Tax=Camelimonas lactis TaxID=659006 RepID=UPI00104ED897
MITGLARTPHWRGKRHTHATRLIQNGLSVYEVREVLGHADIKTTMRYAHLEKATVLKKARDVIERLNGV